MVRRTDQWMVLRNIYLQYFSAPPPKDRKLMEIDILHYSDGKSCFYLCVEYCIYLIYYQTREWMVSAREESGEFECHVTCRCFWYGTIEKRWGALRAIDNGMTYRNSTDYWKVPGTRNEWNPATSWWQEAVLAATWNNPCGSQPVLDWSPRRTV